MPRTEITITKAREKSQISKEGNEAALALKSLDESFRRPLRMFEEQAFRSIIRYCKSVLKPKIQTRPHYKFLTEHTRQHRGFIREPYEECAEETVEQNLRSRADEGLSKPMFYTQRALNPRSINPNF